ncbi:MAG: hypothetical protein DRH06_00530 [Deltaproteobacteria bacterium]|nr:MAG: hypothetical protein DRH07_01315 [Deltaproteobacteria bacterium]RLB78886.1 MAG: hypothetical protein DRH06_00530 [Deltaproteobacteria bacterium]
MTALQFLERRFSALAEEDYAAVYDSYHHDAPFLQQFGSRSIYIRFAEQQLSGIEIKNWYCLCQRMVAETQLEVLLVMELETAAGSQFFYELAMLIETDAGWRYHSAQKLGAEDYSGSPDKISFHHFDNAPQKIRF